MPLESKKGLNRLAFELEDKYRQAHQTTHTPPLVKYDLSAVESLLDT